MGGSMNKADKVADKNDSARPRYEVADVFRQYGEQYRKENSMTSKQKAVMYAVENCRTSTFGYHVDGCDQCGHLDVAYNSCRDRHCPKCQGVAKRLWVQSRIADLLPVAYYHVVFTLPHFINCILEYNRELFYNLLFDSASETLVKFGQDPKWLGGLLGFFGILHTWGQTIWRHAHVHFIVPGGALTADGRWIEPRYRYKFIFPVKALSEVFRGTFIGGLKGAYYQGRLVIPDSHRHLSSSVEFERWIDRLVNRDWVVYCKRPFGSAEQVVRYVGRYTHRVAISNGRILDIADGHVRFKYKDYKEETLSCREMNLPVFSFIKRFLLHVLPEGFHKIRHYGFLSNGKAKTSIQRIREILDAGPLPEDIDESTCPLCPKCGIGKLRPKVIVNGFGEVINFVMNSFNNRLVFDTS